MLISSAHGSSPPDARTNSRRKMKTGKKGAARGTVVKVRGGETDGDGEDVDDEGHGVTRNP